jgi:hypothetical protein
MPNMGFVSMQIHIVFMLKGLQLKAILALPLEMFLYIKAKGLDFGS